MGISEFEIKKWEKELDAFMNIRRPPPYIRNEVDLAYRIEGQSVSIFEIRPGWQNPNEKIEIPLAKATYVKTKNSWKVFWQMSDLKWHSYEPAPIVKSLRDFISLVAEDKYACFFG
jgi:hypothetical protein